MKTIGLGLAILGVIVLVYGGINYNRQRTLLDVGGIKATVTEHKTTKVAPILGALSLFVGAAMLMKRRQHA